MAELKNVFLNVKNYCVKYNIFLLLIFVFYLFTRLYLFSHQGPAAFGYDTGIYRHIIEGYYERLNDPTIVPFGFSGYSNMLQFLGQSTDDILLSWYLIIAAALFFSFYLFVKTYTNKQTAIIAVFLFSLSVVQYEFFWWFYYRNFLAIFFFLITLVLLHYRSYLSVISLIALGTVHSISLLPIGVSILLCFIFQKNERKFFFTVGASSLVAILFLNYKEFLTYLPFLQESKGVAQNVSTTMEELNGQFVDAKFFFKHTFLYLPFGVLGFFLFWKKHLFLSLNFLAASLPIILGILFYRRFFVFLDIFLIFFAACILYKWWEQYKGRLIQVSFALFFAVGVFLSAQHVLGKQSLLTASDLHEMEILNSLPPSNVITISSATAPWLYGYTHHNIIAPGVFEHNKWNREQWEVFWMTSDSVQRSQLLDMYARPLYIYIGPFEHGFERVFMSNPQFSQVNGNLWQYIP